MVTSEQHQKMAGYAKEEVEKNTAHAKVLGQEKNTGHLGN